MSREILLLKHLAPYFAYIYNKLRQKDYSEISSRSFVILLCESIHTAKLGFVLHFDCMTSLK